MRTVNDILSEAKAFAETSVENWRKNYPDPDSDTNDIVPFLRSKAAELPAGTSYVPTGNAKLDTIVNNFTRRYAVRWRYMPNVDNPGTNSNFMENSAEFQIPPRDSFKSDADYLHTIAHELAHATRVFVNRWRPEEFGFIFMLLEKDYYALEEIVAETTATLLLEHIGEPTYQHAIPYIGNYMDWGSVQFTPGYVEIPDEVNKAFKFLTALEN